jgi:hypothetical protein
MSALSPAVTTICLSPNFTGEDDQRPLLDFFHSWFPKDYIRNRAGEYAHHAVSYRDVELLNFLRSQVARSNVTKREEALVETLSRHGLDDVATWYEELCAGKLERDEFARRIEAALAAARR